MVYRWRCASGVPLFRVRQKAGGGFLRSRATNTKWTWASRERMQNKHHAQVRKQKQPHKGRKQEANNNEPSRWCPSRSSPGACKSADGKACQPREDGGVKAAGKRQAGGETAGHRHAKKVRRGPRSSKHLGPIAHIAHGSLCFFFLDGLNIITWWLIIFGIPHSVAWVGSPVPL